MQVNSFKSSPVFNVQSDVINSINGSCIEINLLYMLYQGQEIHFFRMFSVSLQMMCYMYHDKCDAGFEIIPTFIMSPVSITVLFKKKKKKHTFLLWFFWLRGCLMQCRHRTKWLNTLKCQRAQSTPPSR